MSKSSSNPMPNEIRNLAVRNFEHMMRVMRISGIVLSVIGLALCIVGVWIIIPEIHMLPGWYQLIMQMTVAVGVVLTGNGFLRPRKLPIYLEPVTPAEKKQSHEWLYFYGRPMRGIWLEVLRPIVFTMPAVVVIVLYLAVYELWPSYADQALVGGAILIFIALFVLVKYYLLPQGAKSEAWYTEHFPDDAQNQPIVLPSPSSNRSRN